MGEERWRVRHDVPMPTPAPFERTAAALRRDILGGTFAAGEFLPGQRELAERYGVAYNTAAQALKVLAAEGLVEVIPRKGSVVLASAPPLEITWDREAYVRPTAGGGSADELHVETLQAPEHVSHALGLEPGAQVLARRTALSHSGAPWAARTLFIPRWVANEVRVLGAATPVDEADALAERGLGETGFLGRWSARSALPDEERLLRSASAPVHVVERTALHGQRPVVFAVTAVRADRVFMSRAGGSGIFDPEEPGS